MSKAIAIRFNLFEAKRKEFEEHFGALPTWYKVVFAKKTIRNIAAGYKMIGMAIDTPEWRKEHQEKDCEKCDDTGVVAKKVFNERDNLIYSDPWRYCVCALGETAKKHWK